MSLREALGHGVGAGLLAGSLVGATDALAVLGRAGMGEYTVLVHGVVLYGLAGAILGGAVGALLAWMHREPLRWSLCAGVVLVGMGYWSARERASIDLFDSGPVSEGWRLGLGLAAFVLAVLVTWLGPILLTRTPLAALLRCRGVAAAMLAEVCLAAIFAFAPVPGGPAGRMVPEDRSAELPQGARDMVLIVAHGLRADAPLPFAERSLVFSQAVSQAGWARGSMASILTSSWPPATGCMGPSDGLIADTPTLAEVLGRHGYATGAVVGDPALGRTWGLNRGFDWYRVVLPPSPAGNSESAWRLGIHRLLRPLLGVSSAGSPTEVLAEGRRFIAANRAAGGRSLLVIHLPGLAPPWAGDDPVEGYHAAVDGVVAELRGFVDDALDEGALVVLTSDLGVELGEHGAVGSGGSLFEEMVRVPLLFMLPGGQLAGAVAPWSVRSIDVAPTVVRLAGVAPPEGWTGRDLLDGEAQDLLTRPASDPPPATELSALDRPALAVLPRDRAAMWRAGGWKYVRAEGFPRLADEALYQLEVDPREMDNRVGYEGARRGAWSQALRSVLDHAALATGPGAGIGCAECRRREVVGQDVDCTEICDN